MKNDVITHYNLLIDENNDPVSDPEPLREYMDRWDGEIFINLLELDKSKSVLEIGIGTGRLALRTAPRCKTLTGIDISPKTAERAKSNLSKHSNISIICGDFMVYEFDCLFDVIYSSLTFMHIEEKQDAVSKVGRLIKPQGRFVLSIDKNRDNFIDMGTRKIEVYPDSPGIIAECIEVSGMFIDRIIETEAAYIFAALKK